MRKFLIAVLPLTFLFQAVLLADEMEDHFKLLDKNADGKISSEESKIWDWPKSKFKWSDTNSDSHVDLNEFKIWLSSKKAREHMLHLTGDEFQQMDGNKDGRISYQECWCTEELFRKLDVNHDKFLSKAEAHRQVQVKPKLRVIRQKSKKSKS